MVNSSSYKKHIPESLKQSICQRNFLVQLRIMNVFKRFLSEFKQKTVMERSVTQLDLKLKYIATLETLTEGFGYEIFEPVSLRTLDAEGGHDQSQNPKQPASYQVLVSGTAGIQWRLKPSEVRGDTGCSINLSQLQDAFGTWTVTGAAHDNI